MPGQRTFTTILSYLLCLQFTCGILRASLTLASSVKTICILPDEASASCHKFIKCQDTSVECYHLSAVMSGNISSDISWTNTRVIFYPGIHTVNKTINNVFSVSNATTFELTAANLSEGATIKCNGNIGFAFNFCTDLKISGITFVGCGTHISTNGLFEGYQMVTSKFVLLIYHSINVYISDIYVMDGMGIGLLLVNVHGFVQLSNSEFINNTCNLYYFSDNRGNILNDTTNFSIKNSQFSKATSCKHKDKLIGSIRSAGVVLKLSQTRFKVTAFVNNITLVKNKKYNVVVEVDYRTSEVSIENITSVSVDNKLGMWIYFNSLSTDRCFSFHSTPCTAVKIKHADFKRGGIIVTNRGYRQNQQGRSVFRYQLLLLNISFENSGRLYPLFVAESPRVTFDNISIKNAASNVVIKNCNALFGGHFIYQESNGSVLLLGQNKITMVNATVIVTQNRAPLYTPVLFSGSYVQINDSFVAVMNNTGLEGGGIILFNSTFVLSGNSKLNFLCNIGSRGGALSFYQSSELLFLSGTTNLTFVGNHARDRGGAIFVQDEDYLMYGYIRKLKRIEYKNFYSYPSGGGMSNFYFSNNTAVQAGTAVFGGTIDSNFHFYDSLVNDTSVVSSVPLQVCICTNSLQPNCGISRISVRLLPGQSYELLAVAVGGEYGKQMYGTVPSTVSANFVEESYGQLKQNEYVQSTNTNCTKLTYTVQFSNEYELLRLTTNEQTWKEKKDFDILFHRENCTVGFTLDTASMNKCVCAETLKKHEINCDINTLTVQRPAQKWIGTTFSHLPLESQRPGVLVHDYCPLDYCITTNRSIQPLDLHYPNKQCAFNRSGILCGSCEANFSSVLGTSKCKQCTKPWIALVIPLVAILGLALVVVLMMLNLTVSVGTINGVIFYANIVRANHSIFFPHNTSSSFLSMFIAWLNLDLGVESCFYNGFDAYSKTWFQFLFPLYIWIILIAVIITSHYSTRISRVVGNNAVQVLATLFLLSYAKLLRIIITVFSSTELIYPDGYHRQVWIYDGNVDYLTGKHIPLFIAALMILVMISIPFTLILFCIQWLQKLSNLKALFWVKNLMPLFDAYTGPYKIKHRYWTGVLLLVRVSLFLLFSFNVTGNPSVNLLATSISMSCICGYLSLIGGVYKQWWLNVIETTLILNLLILSTATLYQINAIISTKPITYTSTSITLVLFVAIILYHLVIKVNKRNLGLQLLQKLKNTITRKPGSHNVLQTDLIQSEPIDKVTYSVIQLEDPLI